jgi:hypothetical protein
MQMSPEAAIHAVIVRVEGKHGREKKDVKLAKRSQYVIENKGSASKNKAKTNPPFSASGTQLAPPEWY